MRGSFAIIATSLNLNISETPSPLHSLTLPSVIYLFVIQPWLRSILCEHGSGVADPVICERGAHGLPHTLQRLLPGKRLKMVQPSEQDGAAPKLKKQNFHMIWQLHFWVNIPKELKAGSGRAVCTPKFIAMIFTATKKQRQPQCPWVDG